ncbi:hypothetical protein FQN52_003805 [Onygenales sp. PD_12]|nr:hypothetical protein FQN52_003805 [Onygenales sp. PD_12]
MDDSTIIEIWTEYALGIFLFALRFYARWQTVGLKQFGLDDFFCALSVCIYTINAGTNHGYEKYGTNVGLNSETALLLPPEKVRDFILGSKCLYVAWIFYMTLTWALKGVLLTLYNRLTLGLWQHKLVKIVSAFCVISWCACIVAHFAVCTPIHRAWQVVPYPGDDCVLREPNHVLVGTLNILCDLGIMAIPLPILFSARIEFRRKLVLILLFSSGLFVIVTVILRLIFSFGDINSITTAGMWAMRETFVAIIVVTAPGIKPLFNKTTWIKSSSNGAGSKMPGSQSLFNSNNISHAGVLTTIEADESRTTNRQYYELSSGKWPRKSTKSAVPPSDSSQEHIVVDNGNTNTIHVVTEYRLDHESSDEFPAERDRGIDFDKAPVMKTGSL